MDSRKLNNMNNEQIVQYLVKKNLTCTNPLYLTFNEACILYKHKHFETFNDKLQQQILSTINSSMG